MSLNGRILLFVGSLFCLFSCNEGKVKERPSSTENISETIDTVQIYHQTLPVTMTLKGYPDYWKKETVFAGDSSQIISVLVERGQKVEQNAYLLSLWHLYQKRDFTPVDILAPFNGTVAEIFVDVGSRIAEGKPLLHIYNDAFYAMTVKIQPDQLKILKKNQKAIHISPGLKIEGFVEAVDKNQGTVRILFENRDYRKEQLDNLEIEVLCGKVDGDFIISSAFNDNKLMAYIDDESTFEIRVIAFTDSLSLISPALPHLSKLSVISHNK